MKVDVIRRDCMHVPSAERVERKRVGREGYIRTLDQNLCKRKRLTFAKRSGTRQNSRQRSSRSREKIPAKTQLLHSKC